MWEIIVCLIPLANLGKEQTQSLNRLSKFSKLTEINFAILNNSEPPSIFSNYMLLYMVTCYLPLPPLCNFTLSSLWQSIVSKLSVHLSLFPVFLVLGCIKVLKKDSKSFLLDWASVMISSQACTISFFTNTSWTTCHERMFFYFYFLPCITRMLHASDTCLSFLMLCIISLLLHQTHVEHAVIMCYTHVLLYIYHS